MFQLGVWRMLPSDGRTRGHYPAVSDQDQDQSLGLVGSFWPAEDGQSGKNYPKISVHGKAEVI